MRFTVVTLFPEAFDSALDASLLGKARAAGLVEIDFVNPRDFTEDRHRTVDDAPYGGGPGMVMKPAPLVAAIESVAPAQAPGAAPAGDSRSAAPRPHRVLLSPVGAPLDQAQVRALAGKGHVVLVCGRYEGVDQRVVDLCIDQELSLGDFVLSGGEFAALAVIDAVARLVPGVLGDQASAEEESFSDGATLEYPQYTRPPSFRGLDVPEVLIGGHHERVRAWRRRESLRRTAVRRPELLARRRLAPPDQALAADDPSILPQQHTYVLLAHHPVFDRTGAVVTSSVTNLDIHDIARSATTYGLAGYFPITPIAVQREKIDHIGEVWRAEVTAQAQAREPADRPSRRPRAARAAEGDRSHALSRVESAASIEDAIEEIARRHRGARPWVVATSARCEPAPEAGPAPESLSYLGLRARMAARADRPVALLFGTGHGLAGHAISLADWILEPINGQPAWNHLSVRSAVAVILDRLFGCGA